MPPDQNAPPRGLSNHEAAQQIQQGLKAEPSLRDSSIAVHVDEAKVVLSGTLQNEPQRDRALRIARSYAGEREVVDKLKMQQGM
jgi:osmotically-inducible protein OsmY